MFVNQLRESAASQQDRVRIEAFDLAQQANAIHQKHR